MAYRDFINDHRKGLTGSALLFYGAEDYLMELASGLIISENVPEDSRDLDVVRLDGDKLTAYAIMSEARTYSMFSEKRVILVRNYLPLFKKAADEGLDELIGFVKEAQDTSVIVFIIESSRAGSAKDLSAFGKKMAKACSSYEMGRLERADLKSFITRRVQAAGKLIARRELEQLIDITGYYNRESSYDLAQLDKDISKLVKAAAEDSISADLIEDILIGDSDRFVFDLVDALMAGDRSKALSVAEAIIRDEDGAMMVLALLTKQFEMMYDALELSERGMSTSAMAKKTGVNEYRFKKAFSAARKYSLPRVRRILKDLYNTDRDIKRGDIDKDVALELVAISACP